MEGLGSLASMFAHASAPDAPMSRLPGDVIGGHFQIEGLLGLGGMGEVYRARDLRLGREVALKINLGIRGAPLDRQRREATALARLAHPNVLTIYEIGEHDGDPFIAMELVGGGTARSWLRDARSWRDILAFYHAVGRGLAAAHAAGVVHCDVKPENILVGADGRPRIGDFGLARMAVEAEQTSKHGDAVAAPSGGHAEPSAALDVTLTGIGVVFGTPRYMAPEQHDGKAVDAYVDQFAFCVALYEALAGVHPFIHDGLALRGAIAEQRVRAPAGRRPPRRILEVVARGLREDPAERWPSMDRLLAALARAARSPRRRLVIALAAI